MRVTRNLAHPGLWLVRSLGGSFLPFAPLAQQPILMRLQGRGPDFSGGRMASARIPFVQWLQLFPILGRSLAIRNLTADCGLPQVHVGVSTRITPLRSPCLARAEKPSTAR